LLVRLVRLGKIQIKTLARKEFQPM
jgi:hypothetical protein